MSIELTIAIFTQWANYLSLWGSFLAQTAAQMEFTGKLDEAGEELAGAYNVLGNQLTTIAAVIYFILGQAAIAQVIEEIASAENQAENQAVQDQEVTLEADLPGLSVTYFRIWRIKKVKKLRHRRWYITQHYRRISQM